MKFLISFLSKTLTILIVLGVGGIRAQPTANSLNSQPLNNQLTSGDQVNGVPSLKGETTGQFMFQQLRNPSSNPPPQQQPSYNQPGYQQTSASYPPAPYGRDVQSAPILGLASNGEFQLSAFFSQFFWGFVAVTVTIAIIIAIIRFMYPTAGIGGIVSKLKESTAARSIDLDKLTNVVYGALDSYGKWAVNETPHLKTR